jgi:hypothetical protein
LRGTVYYNTYNSKLQTGTANGSDGNGAVLSIQPGAFAPRLAVTALLGKCHACHEVSTDGSTLFTATSIGNDNEGRIYDLKQSPVAQIGLPYTNTATPQSGGMFTYGGIYPDGTMALTSSQEDYHAWPNVSDLRSVASYSPAMAAGGLGGAVTRAVTPSFSPDGQHVAFNFWSGAGAIGVTAGGGRSLAAMDFSCGAPMSSVACGAPPYTFTALRELYRAPAGHYVGWPSFTPDSKMVVFQHTVTACGDDGSVLNTRTPAQAELWLADVPDPSTGATRFSPERLCAANGYSSTDCTTPLLPTNGTHPDDEQLNFEPNVTPIAAGGYYWVVFTSRRLYGNVATGNPYWPQQSQPATNVPVPTKKLWMAAIDPNPKATGDPSHPAFYLPGQEIAAGNMRAYWVNEPCHPSGSSCLTGDECCTGYCTDNGMGMLQCGNKPAGCVPEYGKCTTSSDCCGNGTLSCIGGLCSINPIS